MLFRNELDDIGSGNAHDECGLIRRVGGIPVGVGGYMAMPVVAALGHPVLLIAIVVPGILSIDRWIGKAVGPDRRNAVRALDPAT